MLTDEEMDRLVLMVLRTRHPRPVERHELELVAEWAWHVRESAETLRQVLAGELGIDVQDGRLCFRGLGDGEAGV